MWKELLYKEPLEPGHFTAEEAFKGGQEYGRTKQNNPVSESYDAAARSAARRWYESALTDEKARRALESVNETGSRREKKEIDHSTWEDLIFKAVRELPSVDDLGLSAFQAGWAVQAAAGAWKEEHP